MMRLRVFAITVSLVAVLCASASAQYSFGKNKVQYTDFNWMVLTTARFDIYFYESERELAELTAETAERSYDILADRFNHEVTKRIPLIIYSSPNFFSETNVVSSLLPENVGGFTEFMKGRVTLPFNGSFPEFRRVLQHELVHVFTYSKLTAVTRDHKKINSASPPLWFTEGLAEYYSGPWDTDGDMIMSDMVLSGRLSSLDGMTPIYGTYLMYKAGESFFHFVGQEYGPDYILRIFENWWRGKNFEDIMQITFNKPLQEIGVEWGYWLKKKYFPTLEDRELPDRLAEAVTTSGYNVKPVPLRLTINNHTEDWIAFKGNRLGYAGLYMTSGEGHKKRLETLLRGERSPAFESLHLLGSALDVSPAGNVVFSSKKHERDVIYVLDPAKREVVAEYVLDSLYVISSPSYSPDGSMMVFSGSNKDGIHDLYLFKTATETLHRLTDDIYLDSDPVFTPDGRAIVFSSDRGRYGNEGCMNLFRLTLGPEWQPENFEPDAVPPSAPAAAIDGSAAIGDSIPAADAGAASPNWPPDPLTIHDVRGRMEPLTEGHFNDKAPSFSKTNGDMLFSSDRDGRFNIYRRAPDGRIDRITNVATGALDPCYMPEGDGLVFTAYQRSSFQIFTMPLPDSGHVVVVRQPDTINAALGPMADTKYVNAWNPEKGTGDQTRSAVKYRNRFSFDIAQSAVSFDAFYGTLGGFQTALTDILGNHQYYFLLANTADTKENFFKSFNVAVNYINREHRLNYGYGAFHLFDEYDDPVDGPLRERQYGAAGYIGYPFSKFRRLESSVFVRESEREELYGGSKRNAVLATEFIGFVQDNSLWDISGPIDGHRFMVSLGYTADLSNFRSFNRLAVIDARKYFRLGRYSAFAVRLLGHFSSGQEPRRRYFGGSWDLRGYPRRGEYARNVILASNELRFPLIDALLVGLPVASLGFQAIRGAIFFDAGNAWENDFGRMQGSMGVGARVSLGYFIVLRFDWARRTNFRKIDDRTRFEFFFGWNF